jgi:alcohol dehydrogenase
MTAIPEADDPVHLGWPLTERPFLAVVDPWAHELAELGGYLSHAEAVYELTGRPTVEAADEADELVSTSGVSRIVSIGAGLVIDAAKLTVFRHRERRGELLEHVAIPCGPEPYRAVAPFSMYEGPPGVRDGVWEDWLRPVDVAVVPELLDRLDPTTVALFSGDSLVHAVESVLTTLSNTESEGHALPAAGVFAEQVATESPARVELVLASIAAARAFDTTKLGLAHALSRPLGIAAGISHDGYNLMLGPAVVMYWGDDLVSSSPLAAIETVEPTARAWAQLIDGYRAKAELPAALPDTGLEWQDAEAAMEWAPNSSGIPNLPRPLEPDTLERILRAAWDGNAAP